MISLCLIIVPPHFISRFSKPKFVPFNSINFTSNNIISLAISVFFWQLSPSIYINFFWWNLTSSIILSFLLYTHFCDNHNLNLLYIIQWKQFEKSSNWYSLKLIYFIFWFWYSVLFSDNCRYYSMEFHETNFQCYSCSQRTNSPLPLSASRNTSLKNVV